MFCHHSVSFRAALHVIVVGLFCCGGHNVLAANDPFAALPFEVVATTPRTLLDGKDFTSQRGQALQIVFSRPVISIGSDWDSTTSQPFSVAVKNSATNISSIASQRWVTTYIFRLDPLPDHESLWPTNLELLFSWNRALKTWVGVSMSAEHQTSLKVSGRHVCYTRL
jgi:hypothetical protein